jgi:hypothetical protein
MAGPDGIVTVALVLASRRTGVTRYPALESSDFPRAATAEAACGARPSDRLSDLAILSVTGIRVTISNLRSNL